MPSASGCRERISTRSSRARNAFRLDRERNRHITFGAGPHRCAGSNLARLNLRVAVAELTSRLTDFRLQAPEDELPFHTAFNRSPLALPLAFSGGRGPN